MTSRELATAAAIGGVSGVLSMVTFAIVLTSTNKALQDRKNKQPTPAPKLTVVPKGAS